MVKSIVAIRSSLEACNVDGPRGKSNMLYSSIVDVKLTFNSSIHGRCIKSFFPTLFSLGFGKDAALAVVLTLTKRMNRVCGYKRTLRLPRAPCSISRSMHFTHTA